MAGLPRSGNTLLTYILNQNPDLHVSANSPVSWLSYQLSLVIPQREEYLSCPKPNFIKKLVKSTIDNYYEDVNESHVIDRSGAWGLKENYSILKECIIDKPKVICPIRSIPEILTSFITLCDKNPGNFIDVRLPEVTNANRCQFLMKPKSMIDVCLRGYTETLIHTDAMFIEYDDIVFDTKNTINKIYNFLGVQRYEHNYAIIEGQKHDDSIYGMPLHEVRKTIQKTSKSPEDVLGKELVEMYSEYDKWKQLI